VTILSIVIKKLKKYLVLLYYWKLLDISKNSVYTFSENKKCMKYLKKHTIVNSVNTQI